MPYAPPVGEMAIVGVSPPLFWSGPNCGSIAGTATTLHDALNPIRSPTPALPTLPLARLQDNAEMFDAQGHRRKLVIFTEHRDTLNYLQERIKTMLGSADAVVTIHGGLNREVRMRAQEAFTQDKKPMPEAIVTPSTPRMESPSPAWLVARIIVRPNTTPAKSRSQNRFFQTRPSLWVLNPGAARHTSTSARGYSTTRSKTRGAIKAFQVPPRNPPRAIAT